MGYLCALSYKVQMCSYKMAVDFLITRIEQFLPAQLGWARFVLPAFHVFGLPQDSRFLFY